MCGPVLESILTEYLSFMLLQFLVFISHFEVIVVMIATGISISYTQVLCISLTSHIAATGMADWGFNSCTLGFFLGRVIPST